MTLRSKEMNTHLESRVLLWQIGHSPTEFCYGNIYFDNHLQFYVISFPIKCITVNSYSFKSVDYLLRPRPHPLPQKNTDIFFIGGNMFLYQKCDKKYIFKFLAVSQFVSWYGYPIIRD